MTESFFAVKGAPATNEKKWRFRRSRSSKKSDDFFSTSRSEYLFGAKNMADFVQSNETKNAVRNLAAPISDVTTFDGIEFF